MWDLSIFASADTWIALLTLAALEIVLGIDNIVFISILTDKLPVEQQPRARSIGLMLALGSRLGLLFAINWVMGLTAPLFSLFAQEISGRDLILGIGGLFLIGKATHEIFAKLEVSDEDQTVRPRASYGLVLAQIILLDVVFSLDSVITAVGMAEELLVMVLAMVAAVGVMLAFAGAIAGFVNRHPSMKILALSFLLMIGVMLCAESLGQHINKGYIYFAMGFSLLVEIVNLRLRKKQLAVKLHQGSPRPSAN